MSKFRFSKLHLALIIITLFLFGIYNCSDDDDELSVESKNKSFLGILLFK